MAPVVVVVLVAVLAFITELVVSLCSCSTMVNNAPTKGMVKPSCSRSTPRCPTAPLPPPRPSSGSSRFPWRQGL